MNIATCLRGHPCALGSIALPLVVVGGAALALG
jgi:hypothetical protein